jgi:putative PEP-CTERM system histidine kinase
MTFELALHGASALLCAGLAAGVLWRDRRSFVHQAFAVGMAILAAEAAVTALGAEARSPTARLVAERLRLLATALLPWAWLRFSLAFARSDYREFVRQWRPVIWTSLLLPSVLATLIGPHVYVGAIQPAPGRWLLALGWAGYLFHLVFLAGAVLILANLERTLRASTGSMRWFIKYMVLGVGGLFAARIYTSSQALLFRFVDSGLHVVESAVLLVAAVLMLVSLVRSRLRDADVYVSQSVLYNSITALLVGIYLLVVGIVAQAVVHIGGVQELPAVAFVVFLGLVGLTGLLLSDRLRQRVRAFVSRNFRRPHYDYRKEWVAFTRATSTLLEMKALCAAVAGRVSETLRVPSVTVWLLEEDSAGRVALGGSTVYSEGEAATWAARHGAALIGLLRDRSGPIDLHELRPGDAPVLPRSADTRYAVALAGAGEALGVMVLGGRPDGQLFTVEDRDLLKTLADQAAGNIIGLRLSHRLFKAKEMEAFQRLSAFFVHDLKNLASKLSLSLQNLPAHYDDPEFRRDLLATIERSVAKINDMCTRLSPLSRTLELQRAPGDLSRVVGAALAGLDGSLKAAIVEDLRPTPPVAMDPEQIHKVVLNLVLNANDAVGEGGRIHVATGQADGWVYLSVSDNGCGMSREFMDRSLFKPFRTTKGQGLGIGLFHSKTIVEAHRGRIEVESEEGKGTTFRVMLPGVPDDGALTSGPRGGAAAPVAPRIDE